MREILFRGFTPDENGKEKVYVKNKWITGKWVVGSYMALDKTTYCVKEDYEKYPDNTEHFIVFDKMTDWGLPNRHLRADVIPETVGQYIGLKDKNDKKIFEGDIIASNLYTYIIQIGEYEPNNTYYITTDNCEYNVGKIYGVYAHCIEDKKFNCIIPVSSKAYQIIGNIYDNPELLKGSEK